MEGFKIMSTINKFLQRRLYDQLLPTDFFNQNFIDLTTLNRYAIVDTKNNLIVPREEKLKTFDGAPDSSVLSFVSLAYEAMMEDLEKQIQNGGWEKDSIFLNVKPATGFDSPFKAFDAFMAEQFQKIRSSIYKNRKIVDFPTFLNVFHGYISSRKYNFPYTFTGFLERQNNPHSTALQIEFVKGEKNNFDKKIKYLSDVSFKRFLLLAEKHGFYVNRDTPWSIIANIDSPAMQIYASQDAGINIGTEGIIERYYTPATKFSFDFFTQYLIGTYNAVASDEPVYDYLVSSSDSCTGYNKIRIIREPVINNKATVNGNKQLLQLLYLTIRYYENFSDRVKYSNVLREYKTERKLNRYPFSEMVERLVGPAKNSSILFYGVTGATSITSFEFPFEAEEFAAKLGSSGAHKMSNGRWMPCATHEEYLSLTSP